MLLLCILRKLCAKVLLGLCCPCTFQASETPDPFCNLIDGDILTATPVAKSVEAQRSGVGTAHGQLMLNRCFEKPTALHFFCKGEALMGPQRQTIPVGKGSIL